MFVKLHERLSCNDEANADISTGDIVVQLIQTFWGLCLLRNSPGDLPRSSLLLVFSAALYALPELARHVFVESVSQWDLLALVAGILAAFLFYGLILTIHGLQARFMQMATAILGAGAILSALLFIVGTILGETEVQLSVGWILLGWSILVEGNIIARTLQQKLMVGVSLAVVVVILQLGIYVAMGPLPEQAG